jgi:hypothetical protein
VAALLSAISVITLLFVMSYSISIGPLTDAYLQISNSRSRSHLGDYTLIPVLFGSLLVSNLLQSIGTIMGSQWVHLGMVLPGTLCSLQGLSITTWPAHIPINLLSSMALGGVKQAGNVGTAVW